MLFCDLRQTRQSTLLPRVIFYQIGSAGVVVNDFDNAVLFTPPVMLMADC